MKNRQEVRDRLEPYLTQLELGALPADRNAEFNALLADDNAARQYVADYLTTAALIEWSLSRGQEAVFRPTAEDGTSLWRRCGEHAYDFVSNYITLSVIVSALVIANVVLLMAVIVPNADRGNPGVEPPSTEFVARISDSEQASFDATSDGNFRNRDLFDDDTIVLNGGLVVIEYDTGARVVLEGPAVYHVQGANGGDLRVGKLTARVETEQAQGFTVEIPHARIVDLGTEFGIEVAEDGGSNVGVIDGKVRLHGLSGAAARRQITLEANQVASVAATDGSIRRIVDAKDETLVAMRLRLTQMESRPASGEGKRLIAHWKFDETDGRTATDSVGGYHGRLGWSDGDGIPNIGQPGKFGTAYQFRPATNDVVDLTDHLPRFVPLRRGSVSLWFQTTSARRSALFSLGSRASANRFVIEIGGSVKKGDNAGKLRLVVREKNANLIDLTSSETFHDGQWHHLVVTQNGREAKLYVDGDEVTQFEMNTSSGAWFDDISQPNTLLIGNDQHLAKYPGQGPFDGRIDDVAIYNFALTANDIARIFRSSSTGEQGNKEASSAAIQH